MGPAGRTTAMPQWEFEDDHGGWRACSKEDTEKLMSCFNANSHSVQEVRLGPKSLPYEVNFDTMKQRNKHTGKVRGIRLGAAGGAAAAAPAASSGLRGSRGSNGSGVGSGSLGGSYGSSSGPRSARRWQVQLQGRWQDMESAWQTQLNAAHAAAAQKLELNINSGTYIVDLISMVQVNKKTGRKRQIRCWDNEKEKVVSGGADHSTSAPPLSQMKNAIDAMNPTVEFSVPGEARSKYQVFLDHGWKNMSPVMAAKIDQQAAAGATRFEVEDRGYRYVINLDENTQTNVSTGKVRSLRQLEAISAVQEPAARQVLREATTKEFVTEPKHEAEDLDGFRKCFRRLCQSERAGLKLSQQTIATEWYAQVRAPPTLENQRAAKMLVEEAAADVFGLMYLTQWDMVNEDEWVHYWLVAASSPNHHALGILQDKLRQLLKSDRSKKALSQVVRLFQSLHGGDDELSPPEMSELCTKYLAENKNAGEQPIFYPGATQWLADQKRHAAEDIDYTLNYFDVLMHLVGRKTHEVCVYMYDISEGKAQWAGLEGIWHTGVVVFDKEYWYGGCVFESKPEDTPFGKAQKKVPIGRTVCTRDELWNKMKRELCVEYTAENYDILAHNCNNFTDDVAMFLLNSHIPDEVRLQPEVVANSAWFQVARPILNKWFGGFSESVDCMKEAKSADKSHAEEAWAKVDVGSLVVFAREGYTPVTAEVLAKDEGTCDLWWWEGSGHASGRFLEAGAVSRMQIQPLEGKTTGRRRPRGVVSPPTGTAPLKERPPTASSTSSKKSDPCVIA